MDAFGWGVRNFHTPDSKKEGKRPHGPCDEGAPPLPSPVDTSAPVSAFCMLIGWTTPIVRRHPVDVHFLYNVFVIAVLFALASGKAGSSLQWLLNAFFQLRLRAWTASRGGRRLTFFDTDLLHPREFPFLPSAIRSMALRCVALCSLASPLIIQPGHWLTSVGEQLVPTQVAVRFDAFSPPPK